MNTEYENYAICESCRIDVHIEDVVSIVASKEVFCFPCKNEYESEESE